jgi:hypothetical protein
MECPEDNQRISVFFPKFVIRENLGEIGKPIIFLKKIVLGKSNFIFCPTKASPKREFTLDVNLVKY